MTAALDFLKRYNATYHEDRARQDGLLMGAANVELDADIVALLESQNRPLQETARELIVLELYRQGQLSSGRAAELLHLSRQHFIRYASERGIPYFQMDSDELRRELGESESL